ncbi:MAG TPA: Asp-tRNA(Asn)/Glu-tRNA(Gln) amidotransferase subunit GatC [Gemmatimonadaceae bacterium]|jgi:aspartyl-tRNA(Asn)/glutamyl-tRNA(Gln) amidotransferase subunit C|nr:Asp-tRNA(Asn)/Glu-tRNA(Gln) amidotransferase subunit GatC [Gemmatimonadaceae bacterium]
MAVTRDDVAHVAELARIALDDARVNDLVRELNGILLHMDELRKVDTEGVEPTAGVGDAGTPLRPDEGPQIPLDRPREKFAPAMRDGFFIVPRLSTHEDVVEDEG